MRGKRIRKVCLWCEKPFYRTEGTIGENDELCTTCSRFPNKAEAMKFYRTIHKIFH